MKRMPSTRDVCNFPPGFLWGSATAATQVEGAAREDGRGPSQWDAFCANHPERVFERATPEVACDHYHRWAEDVALIAAMGHTAYRFSICWSRVFPSGSPPEEPRGLAFYDRLVDALLARGVEPIVTLYHWDLPLGLAEKGGWESARTRAMFAVFAAVVARRLGDRVRWWTTLNEPGWSTMNGYLTAQHPPLKSDPKLALQVATNMMAAHAMATHALRAAATQAPRVGIAANLSPCRPATDSPEDRAAAVRADNVLNRWLLESALFGRFPVDVSRCLEASNLSPTLPDADLAALATAPVDWLGVNYYYPNRVSGDAPESKFHIANTGSRDEESHLSVKGQFRMVKSKSAAATDWGWEIDPAGLTELLVRVQTLRPGLPQIVTENGVALLDEPGSEDGARVRFLDSHLRAVHNAIRAGADVRGYIMWATMDNFSWVNGYRKRYGFLHVDRATLARTRKASSHWFERVARANALEGE